MSEEHRREHLTPFFWSFWYFWHISCHELNSFGIHCNGCQPFVNKEAIHLSEPPFKAAGGEVFDIQRKRQRLWVSYLEWWDPLTCCWSWCRRAGCGWGCRRHRGGWRLGWNGRHPGSFLWCQFSLHVADGFPFRRLWGNTGLRADLLALLCMLHHRLQLLLQLCSGPWWMALLHRGLGEFCFLFRHFLLVLFFRQSTCCGPFGLSLHLGCGRSRCRRRLCCCAQPAFLGVLWAPCLHGLCGEDGLFLSRW